MNADRDGGDGGGGSGSGGASGSPSGGRGGLPSFVKGAALATAGLTGLALIARTINRRFTAMSENTLKINGVLEEYNGTIAQANAIAEARGIERAIRQGDAISSGYSRLSNAQADYRDIQQQFSAPLQNLGLNITSSIAEFRNSLFRKFEPIMDVVGEAATRVSEWLGGNTDDSTLTASKAFLSDVSDGRFDGHGTTYMNPAQTPLMSDDERRDVFGGRRSRIDLARPKP